MAQIAVYATPAGPRYGLLADGVLHEWDGDPFSDRPVTPGKALGPLDELTILPPVTPSKLVCIGRIVPDDDDRREDSAECRQQMRREHQVGRELAGPSEVLDDLGFMLMLENLVGAKVFVDSAE